MKTVAFGIRFKGEQITFTPRNKEFLKSEIGIVEKWKASELAHDTIEEYNDSRTK